MILRLSPASESANFFISKNAFIIRKMSFYHESAAAAASAAAVVVVAVVMMRGAPPACRVFCRFAVRNVVSDTDFRRCHLVIPVAVIP